MKNYLAIYFETEEMNPETIRHNQSLAMDICTDPCTGIFSKWIPLFADNNANNRVIARLRFWDGEISVVVCDPADLKEVLDRLEAWTFTGPVKVHGEDYHGFRYLNPYGEFDFENAIPEDDFDSEDAAPEPEPVSINRVYVSVFSDKFLIDSDGVLYSRNVHGDINLCMHTEAGNLYTVIGWDLDGEPCTISDSYFGNCF